MKRELPNAVVELFDASIINNQTCTSRHTRSIANKDLNQNSKLKKGNLMFDIRGLILNYKHVGQTWPLENYCLLIRRGRSVISGGRGES